MQAIVAGLAAAVFAAAAFGDIRYRRIPNGLVLAIGALGIGRMALAGDASAAVMTLLASAALLAVGFALFWRGIIGGGDAKLITGATLLVGYHDLFGFLFLMSLCGGILALAVLAQHRLGSYDRSYTDNVSSQRTCCHLSRRSGSAACESLSWETCVSGLWHWFCF